MGYHVSARVTNSHGQVTTLESMRVGTYGSQDVLAAMLLAGYSLGRFQHSDRIRGSWVRPRRGVALDVPHDQLPRNVDPRTRRGMTAWVAFNYGGCTWLDVDAGAVERGRKLKPVECGVLAGLMVFYDRRNDFTDPARGVPTEAETARLADATERVLPGLAESCWHPLVAEFADVCRQAAAAHGRLHFG